VTPLADVLSRRHSAERLTLIVEHMWEMRERTGPAMLGATRPLVVRVLAELLEERLAEICAGRGGRPPSIPLRLLAGALADAQIELLGGWIRGDAAAPPGAVAQALADMTTGAAQALLDRS